MTRLVGTLGDRLLDIFTPTVEAGACVAEHGQCCGCYENHQYHYDCYGNCKRTSVRGCGNCP